MYCTKCGTPNPDTSKFCSECGAKLLSPKPVPPRVEPERPKAARPEPAERVRPEPVEGPPVDHQKIGELLFRAFQQYETDQLDEALKSCEQALKLNPSSTSVHSLLSLIFEKKGDLERAIADVERVLELNPNSAADQERLEQLRRKLYMEPEPPTMMELLRERLRNVPQGVLIAGAAAFVVVFALVLFWPRIAVRTSRPPASVPGNLQASAPQYPYAPAQPSGQPPAQAYPYGPPPPTIPPPQPSNVRPEEPAAEERAPRAGGARAVGAASSPQPFPEVKIEPRRPESERPPAGRAAPASAAPRIDIVTTPRKPQPPLEGAARRVESATLLEQARASQLAGDYADAVRQYQQALQGAANASQIHQQIALCYQRLGKNDQAAAAYRSAIEAYKKQTAEGRDGEEAKRGLAAAQAGLKLVEGRE